ncbi:LacI family DNA-binding transcriptional regulator [Paractinoplanes rishiriensis]|uniref:Transcriptional regulator n=1 Tax=Paractinoplanes rishiriensis TaxID=1050105 RepID=A0A919MW51_9ACTN|nr:LacI family DNA-binding transcriptional regulator [Actinoplanes rishiriensis]GIF02112.1 transcriptional regulator [Actinoplanes rishiriensis]
MIEDGSSAPQRKPRGGRVSLAAIAELAGVSPPTVSKVFNGRDGVGAETRERVEDLLRDHGYRRPPAEVETRSIEVVCHRMLGSIAMEILRGVADVAGANGGTATFTDAGRPWIDALLERRPAGVVSVVAGVTARQAGLLTRDDIPLVVLDPVVDLPGVPVIGSTNWSGALAATRHLLGLGHRRIGVLTGPVKDLAARARLDGFRAALDHAEIRYDESLERRGVFTFDDGVRLGLELLALPDPPTAVVCGDDLQAMGVYEAARRSGRRIPDDLSVVGFDDVDQAAWLAPGLTTVRQPFAEMGALAAKVVLGLTAGEAAGRDRFELGTSLVVRGSTAAVR